MIPFVPTVNALGGPPSAPPVKLYNVANKVPVALGGMTVKMAFELAAELTLLLAINLLQKWSSRGQRGESREEAVIAGNPLEPSFVQ